ncbi:MAG: glycosyltransferase family 4 protein [Chthoniobacterales bacterium]
MKILVLCYEYPPVGGGGGRVAKQIAEGLVKRGHDVKILTGGISSLEKRELQNGIEIHRVTAFRRTMDTCSVPEMGLWLLFSASKALRLIRAWRPDVLHVHFAVPTGALALFLHTFTRTPYLLTTHLGDVPGGVPEQTDKLFRWVKPFTIPIWKKAAAISAVSSHVAKLGAAAYGVKPHILLNGISFDEKNPARRRESTKELRVLFVGRLSTQKNPLLAIEAIAKTQNTRLDMIGDGPLRKDAEAHVEKLDLQDRIHFHGWQSAESVQGFLQQSDVFLLTSLHEGLPVAALEALAVGLPLVSTDIPGIWDVIENEKNGFLRQATPEALAEALQQLENNAALRKKFSQASLERREHFQLEKIIQGYESVLEKITLSGRLLYIKK